MKDKNGKPLHSADARFYVEKTNPELENPVASPGALANLATITGGRSVTPDEFRPLLREILDKKEKIADTIRIKTTLYDQWPIFLFFLSLLTLEWFLRKKWGLV